MPKHSRLFVKPFIGGLNTETSSVEDAILNTADELNCTILPEGIRGRRLGFNIERDGKWIESNPSTVSSIFYWDNVGKKDLDYIVVQRGTVLYFFIKDSSQTEAASSVDLSKYKVTNDVGCLKYSTCAGDLIVVGDWIDPVKISWDIETTSLNVVKVNIKWRDLIGVDDGLRIDEMPAELTPEHKYNLYNQGWDKFVYAGSEGKDSQHAIDAFFEEMKTYPSNNMLHFLDKTSDSAEYNTYELLKHFYGNTPAPKGHYILDYFKRSRSAASGIMIGDEDEVFAESFSDILYMHSSKQNSITRADCLAAGVGIELRWPYDEDQYLKEVEAVFQPTQRFSSIRFELVDGCLSNGNTFNNRGKDVYIRNDDLNLKENWTDQWYVGPILLSVYGIEDDGSETLLKENTYSFPSSGRVGDLAASDTLSFDQNYYYSKVILRIKLLSLNASEMSVAGCWKLNTSFINVGEASIRSKDVINGRVKDITTLGGRYFYLVGDTVLFSQVLKDNGEGFDACYQEADPTSEEISDIVPTDGGYIKFPSMGEGQAIESFNRGVIVFGKSNVFGIISPAEQVLSATSYDIVELSRAGLIGPDSVVSTSDQIFYWSPLGIFRVGLSAETGNTVVAQSVSINTIQEYYNNIPQFSKQNCVGTFDYVNNRIYWYYPTDESAPHKLNRCLILDLTHGAFMAFEIGNKDVPYISYVTRTPNAYEVKPTIYTRAGEDRVVAGEMPVIAAEEESTFNRWTALKHVVVDSEGRFSFGDYNSREFKDFDTAGYESYMVSKPIMFAGFSALGKVVQDTANDKQVPILQTLFKRTEQAKLNTVPKIANKITTYTLKEARVFATEYDEIKEATGGWSRFIAADTWVLNTGIFKGATVDVDLSSFIGKRNVTVDLRMTGGTRIVKQLDKVTLPYVSFAIEETDKEVSDLRIRVYVVINGETVYNKYNLGLKGTLRLLRTNRNEDTFEGFKRVVRKGTIVLKDMPESEWYKGAATFPTSVITAAKFTYKTDEEWTSRDIRNIFTPEGSWLFDWRGQEAVRPGYGIVTPANPTEECLPQSLSYSGITTGIKCSVYAHGGSLDYELVVSEPVYKKDNGLFTTHTKYIAASGANIRMRWGWSLNDRSNRWDMIQNGYRPQKDFLHDEYVESRIHVRGRGKAFQVEIRNDDNKDFRLAGMNLMVRS